MGTRRIARRRIAGEGAGASPWWAILPRALPELLAQARAASDTQPRGQVGYAALEDEDDGYVVRDGVAIIDIAGVMTKGPSLYSWIGWGTAMVEAQALVERAAADPAVDSILLRVDSPGGTVAGVSDLADAVYAARQRKAVTAYISDLGASAAYYVASQAHRIYGDADAMVGSIGVYCVVPDFSEMAAKEGIKIHVIRAGEMKGAGQPGTKITDAQLEDFQREIDQLNETFVDAVARGRGWPRPKVAALNDGRIHVGVHAVELGLLDGISSQAAVLEGMKSQSANKVRAFRAILGRK